MYFILSFLAPVRRLVGWMLGDWRRIAAIAATLALASGWIAAWRIDSDRDSLRRDAAALRSSIAAEQVAHAGTALNYLHDAMRAQHIAFANRALVEARWRAQYKEAVDAKAAYERDYRANLAVWLREHAATANPRSADGDDVPTPPGAAGGVNHNADAAIVPVTDLERCAVAFAHLASLIDFVVAASGVETSPTGGIGQSSTSAQDEGLAKPL